MFIGVFIAMIGIAFLFTTGIGPVLLVALLAAAVLYVVYVVGVRAHNRLIHGQSGGQSGGGGGGA